MTRSVALALGGGGARGLAHVAVLEALEEIGVRPAAIAGASIGAVVGAVYASGMSARDMRRYVIRLAHNRGDAMRRLMASRAGRLSDLFGGGFGDATRLDGEKLCEQFLPETLPEDFAGLSIPLRVVTSDLYRREPVVLSDGPLRPALAASIALPSIVRPVALGDRILVDGGATNPLPFDLLRGMADVIVAVEISGPPTADRREIPNALECLYATVSVMTHSIIAEKLRHGAPDLLLRPNVGAFRALDFFQASAIFRVSEPIKTEVKDRIAALLR